MGLPYKRYLFNSLLRTYSLVYRPIRYLKKAVFAGF